MNPHPPTHPGTGPAAVNGHPAGWTRGRLAVVREPGTGTDPAHPTGTGVPVDAVPVPGDVPDWPSPDLTDPAAPTETGPVPGRRVRLTPASTIRLRPTYWLWDERIPHGALVLGPGREGIGKSLFCAWLTAQVTLGTLPGVHRGHPKSVIYAATEDSWERTIAGRLTVAGADMNRVFRVEVDTTSGVTLPLSLPRDCDDLAAEITRADVALLVLDPLISAVDSRIDVNGEKLREALEPLTALADRTGCAVFGLAHFNKATGTDVLSRITGSRAFAAVARAVMAFARDTTADDGSCVISQVKNNLGRLDLPSLRYRVASVTVDTPEGPGQWGRLDMLGETDTHVDDLLNDAPAPAERAEQLDAATQWLGDYLTSHGGAMASDEVKNAAQGDRITARTLARARKALGVLTEDAGVFPRKTIWRLP